MPKKEPRETQHKLNKLNHSCQSKKEEALQETKEPCTKEFAP